MKKTDGSWKFRSLFIDFCHFWRLYGFIEKQAPQKALCLGPDPPPGENIKFIDFSRFLMILGSSIQPEKASVKSASTANPPQKVKFMAFLWFWASFLSLYEELPFQTQRQIRKIEFFCCCLFRLWSLGLVLPRRKSQQQTSLYRAKRKDASIPFLNQAQAWARTGPLNQAKTAVSDLTIGRSK
jgi:hypothetical protein